MPASIRERLQAFRNALEEIPEIAVRKFTVEEIPDDVADYAALFDDGELPQPLLDFYRRFNGFECKWSHTLIPGIAGGAHFLSMKNMFPYWDGKWTLYTGEDDPPDTRMRTMYPVDFFSDDACVCAFKGADKNPDLYYYNFHGAPQNLSLDIHGYFELMLYASAYRYWQYLILELITGEATGMGEQLRTGMASISGNFSMDEFAALYARLSQ